MYTLILVEAALEKVPRELWGHPSVARHASRRGKPPGEMLLDVSYHYAAMRGLPDKDKRGRPDIIHFSLLEALGSPLSREGRLNVYVHSREGVSIHVKPDTRLPRNYDRFLGLFEQVLRDGHAPASEPLITTRNESLRSLLSRIDSKKRFLLRDQAPQLALRKLAKAVHDAEDSVILVGGFPHGDFSTDTLRLCDVEYAIYPKPLEAWTVVSRILGALEEFNGIYD